MDCWALSGLCICTNLACADIAAEHCCSGNSDLKDGYGTVKGGLPEMYPTHTLRLSAQDAESGKERYVFFSFPHIAVSPYLEPGALFRPGRPGKSAACGALCKALADLQAEGLDANCKPPGSKPRRHLGTALYRMLQGRMLL